MASVTRSHHGRLLALGLTMTLIQGCCDPKKSLCTPIPDLYGQWARATGAKDTTSFAVRLVAEQRRPQVERLPDVYTRLWRKSRAQLDEEGERIAWRDDSVMVVVPQGTAATELVVVPNKEVPFLIDVSPELRRRMAKVAAASSDALASAAGRACEDAARTEFEINAPDAMRLRQLHVRVLPRPPVRASNPTLFYRRVGEVLVTRLGIGTPGP